MGSTGSKGLWCQRGKFDQQVMDGLIDMVAFYLYIEKQVIFQWPDMKVLGVCASNDLVAEEIKFQQI